jgi:hypothetical protein
MGVGIIVSGASGGDVSTDTGAIAVCGFTTVTGVEAVPVESIKGAGDMGVAGELFMSTTDGPGMSASMTLVWGAGAIAARPVPISIRFSSVYSRGNGSSV